MLEAAGKRGMRAVLGIGLEPHPSLAQGREGLSLPFISPSQDGCPHVQSSTCAPSCMPCGARWMPASRQGSPAAPRPSAPPGPGPPLRVLPPSASRLPPRPRGGGWGGGSGSEWGARTCSGRAGAASEEREEPEEAAGGEAAPLAAPLVCGHAPLAMATAPPRLAAGPPRAGAARSSPPTGGGAHRRARTRGPRGRAGGARCAPVACGRLPGAPGGASRGGGGAACTAEAQPVPHAPGAPQGACVPVSGVLEGVCLAVLMVLPLHS